MAGQSGLFDSLVGAAVNTGAAIDALIGIDNILVFAFSDDAHGASIGASTALNTSVSDPVSHYDSLLLIFLGVYVPRSYILAQF